MRLHLRLLQPSRLTTPPGSIPGESIQNKTVTAAQIESAIESEPLEIHSSQYSYQRDYLSGHLSDELENGNPVEFARQYLAAARRAMLHELQAIGAPNEIIELVFAP